MKKIVIINLVTCMALCFVLAYTYSGKKENADCKTQSCSKSKDIKPVQQPVQGGSEPEDQIFQFNRIYIKM